MTKTYHLIFPTKSWEPKIKGSLVKLIEDRLVQNFTKKEAKVLSIFAMPDHVHILIRLGDTSFLYRIVGWVKGECSHWINTNTDEQFYWQRGFRFFEVKEGDIDFEKYWVKDQVKIHEELSLEEEIQKIESRSVAQENER